MKEGTANVHASTVREFMHIITAQAKAALADIERPGFLQMSRLHPNSDDLVPSRFLLDDVEHMISAAITDSEAGHNVFIEGRTVREDLRGNARGTLADTRAVFSLTVDSDADKGMGWSPSAKAKRPSMTVETSPGNSQFWLFLREAINPELAQKLGERIRRAINSDHDTGNPTQPYRVAGTANYPNAKKIERGRVTAPTRLVEFDPEVLWTPEEIEQTFPLPEQPKTDGGAEPSSQADEADIPTDTMRVICNGVANDRDRSLAFYNVVVALTRLGFAVDYMVALFEQHPDGIAKKYEGRVRQETERIYRKIKDRSAPRTDAKPQQQQEPIRIITAEDLEHMTFPPIKYVVPEIFIEGLTLFASKPKMGKSWLVLHAAIAVATGGFTLGELHCIQGDVLYCALEDSERRLRARMDKLGLGWPKRFSSCCKLPRLSVGGLEAIRAWIVVHPEARLIIIDTLAMIREPRKREDTSYDADYQAVLELRQLANEFGIAIVVIHHLRKADSDDAFDTVSGTLGLTGAPDSILIIKRDAGGNLILHGKGRDLIEIEKAMTFDRESCVWRIEGDAAAVRRSAERNAILKAIEEAGEPVKPKDIADATHMRVTNVQFLLGKLLNEGLIEKAEYGRYRRKL